MAVTRASGSGLGCWMKTSIGCMWCVHSRLNLVSFRSLFCCLRIADERFR